MATVVLRRGRAFPEMLLVALAAHLVPEDGATTPAEGGAGVDAYGTAAA